MVLNAHTYYSYTYGTLSVERLLNVLRNKGHQRAVLADINSTSAALSFVRLAPEYGLTPYLGIDFRNGTQACFLGIAKNNQGWYELNCYLSIHLKEKQPFPQRAPHWQHVWVVYPWGLVDAHKLRENERIGVGLQQANRLLFQSPDLLKKCVFSQALSFENKADYNAHRLLRAIDKNTLLSKLPTSELGNMHDVAVSPDEIKQAFWMCPQIIQQTEYILDQSEIQFDFNTTKNKKLYTDSVQGDVELIRRECNTGMTYRYGVQVPSEVQQRVDRELDVIVKMGFAPYFLVNWDMVNYARHRGFPYIGRGSGANSLVAYLMRITDVDPIELNLYFERFINPYRSTPPDFDIDFSWTDRQEVTRYLFDTYGYHKTALLGAYITFQYKSVIREIGKVLGLPAHEIEALQRGKNPNERDHLGRAVLKYASLIQGFPDHLSVHSSGIIIAEQPINEYTATMIPPKGFPTTFFSMLEAEDIGLHKYDVLGQRGLAKIKDAVELIRLNRGVEVDVHDIRQFKQDPKVQYMLKNGQAVGCFYVESPAMRMLLTKLKAHDYIRLVAASSIIRPGVAKSGMMREYILRFQDESRRLKAREELPELYDILEETYGVMVYQEDVLKVAHYFAGLTLAEADVLRRGMNWKYMQRTEFTSVKEKFFSNCKQKGYSDELVLEVWTQIESFANFAFAKGHSASYAVESFQALYLKAYFPLEYMVATLNNGGGFYSQELYLHEASMHGAQVEAPCINRSDWNFSIQGNTIYIGLAQIQGVTEQCLKSILIERNRGGVFKTLRQFIDRLPISLEQLVPLIKVGAFRTLGSNTKELLWDAHFILNKQRKNTRTLRLFPHQEFNYTMPLLMNHPLEKAYNEIEMLGYPLCSPFELLKYPVHNQLRAGHLPFKCNEHIEIVAYLIHRKPTKTAKGELMYFGTWLDLSGQWVDTVHFPPSVSAYPFRGPGCYEIGGVVREEFGFYCLEVSTLRRLDNKNPDELILELKMPESA